MPKIMQKTPVIIVDLNMLSMFIPECSYTLAVHLHSFTDSNKEL